MRYEEKLLCEVDWRKCKGKSPQDVDALMHFLEGYCFIQHPEKGSLLIPLRPAQREILATWTTERYSLVLKARQIGWSTLVALYALWLCIYWPDQSVIMLSKGERESEKLLLKSTYAYDRLPNWMKERGPRRLTRNLKKMSFDNASVIESMPSKEDPGRSSTASLVVVDEWGFLDNPAEAWASIEPIADVGGRVIGLSTANGSGNFFHELWLRAEQGLNDFKPLFFPWSANSERGAEWYEAKARNLPSWQLWQEYPSNADEAFIKSGNPVFDVDQLRAINTLEPKVGRLEWFDDRLRSARFIPEEGGGPLDVWEFPQTGHGYVVGADVAEGLDYGDFSSAHVIDVKTNGVVASWHGHIDPDLYGDVLAALGWWYNAALLGIEVNNHGLATINAVRRHSYPRLYYRKTLDERQQKWLNKVGWATTMRSKPLMIDDLVKVVRDNDLILPCAATISELRTFVRDEKGKMHGSPHDDRVISLSIANQMTAYVHSSEQREEHNDYWTLNYFRKMLVDENKSAKLGSLNVRRAS